MQDLLIKGGRVLLFEDNDVVIEEKDILIKDGKIVDIHVGTVESQENGYDDLSIEQQEELQNRFMELIRKVYQVDCDESC